MASRFSTYLRTEPVPTAEGYEFWAAAEHMAECSQDLASYPPRYLLVYQAERFVARCRRFYDHLPPGNGQDVADAVLRVNCLVSLAEKRIQRRLFWPPLSVYGCLTWGEWLEGGDRRWREKERLCGMCRQPLSELARPSCSNPGHDR